ncbi:hypothetical protein [Phenylobacterium sp.]|uniref:hypothetical protein n=1 Tax=Phenylobacterium sp. TaxID=1871053 RepID=UPI0028110BFD|nr:hypothetical protein [Phenylobacterium sp.]
MLKIAPALFAGLTLALVAGCDKPKDRSAQIEAPAQPAGPSLPPRPPQPAWAAEYLGKGLRQLFPKTGDCIGNTEAVETRYADGVAIIGWGWDNAAKTSVARIVLVDSAFRVVGAGETGMPRPDVPAAQPHIADPNTGWRAIATVAGGPVDAYGITDNGEGACKLGHLKF